VSLGGQHYVAVSGVQLPGNWIRYTGYLQGWDKQGTTTAAADSTAPGHFHFDVRFFRPIVYVNYEKGDGQVQIASVRVRRVRNDTGVTTGLVEFQDLALKEERPSDEIDPGLGVGPICVQCGLEDEKGSITIADADLRDVIWRTRVNRATGTFRISALRIRGDKRTAVVRWWAIKPGARELPTQVVKPPG
jgi:hypothetical protein